MNVAIIPARGGSVRIPRKNIRPFHGKPIIAYSIETAKASGLFERVVVSTEDEEIAGVAMDYGADALMRPRELADDPAVGTQEVTAHALESLPCEFACCIYACAPMMSVRDLSAGLEMLSALPLSYIYITGILYWGRRKTFLDGVELEGVRFAIDPPGRYIDIDCESDWQRAEQMYATLQREVR